MKSIRKWLEEDAGVTLGITSLTSYISRSSTFGSQTVRDAPTGQTTQSQTPPGPKQFVGCDSGAAGPAPKRIHWLKPAGSVATEIRHPQTP